MSSIHFDGPFFLVVEYMVKFTLSRLEVTISLPQAAVKAENIFVLKPHYLQPEQNTKSST